MSGKIIKDWGTENWDEFGWQYVSVIETLKHIFECEKLENYIDDLSTNVGIQIVSYWESLTLV